jgi:creatinine amidohydrolase
MPLELTQISASQIEGLSREKTVFFFPVGPMEDHGPHLPLGMDLEEAYRMSHVAAQHLEEEMPGWVGVLMPRAPLGIDSNTTRLAITIRPHVLRDWLVDSCRSLMRAGFCHFVCFSGHLGPRQLTAIEEAGKMIGRSGRLKRLLTPLGVLGKAPTLISASSGLVSYREVLHSPLWPDPKEHGGARDSSIALAIADSLVDPNYKHLPEQHPDDFRWMRSFKRMNKSLGSYWGNPAEASAAQGEKEILESLEKIFPKMKAVWEGSNPRFFFRTWYSILPPNRSFFRAWILFFLILLFWAGWIFLHSLSYEFS